jgi:hypothetical protein
MSLARRARTTALLASPQRGGVRCASVPSRRPARIASRVCRAAKTKVRPLAEPARPERAHQMPRPTCRCAAVPPGIPAGRTSSAVQTILDGLRGAEGHLLRSRNLDGFAGRGIAAFTRGRFLVTGRLTTPRHDCSACSPRSPRKAPRAPHTALQRHRRPLRTCEPIWTN